MAERGALCRRFLTAFVSAAGVLASMSATHRWPSWLPPSLRRSIGSSLLLGVGSLSWIVAIRVFPPWLSPGRVAVAGLLSVGRPSTVTLASRLRDLLPLINFKENVHDFR